uniref:Prenylcysteine oxidase 1 n=1 Tax=Pyxicephalus adspersus TaxID=30357 RepID=A0AAV3B786_PYXAD|nr:TPA: hypothetical protein GDO54_007805 [Pyxicephalus adspersus]
MASLYFLLRSLFAAESFTNFVCLSAVVGAGIGGTSTAYFLRQKFGKDVQIDVYEKGEVGGRLATIEIEGNQYEAGGSVIHPLNLHMKAFVKELGLGTRTPSGDLVGIYNGDDFVFQESEWFVINVMKMLWNYGLNFLRMYMWVENVLDKFMRIYRYQTFDYSFSTTESMLQAMGGDDFITKINMTIDEAMQKSGFTQRFIDDIVGPAMRVNYGQGVKINGFVAFTRPYQHLVATFVHGRINASFFGCPKPCQFPLSEILTTDNPNLFFCSIGAVYPVSPVQESEESKASYVRVWKIFSLDVLTQEQLHQLFESYHVVKYRKWLAYPTYNPPEKLPPIQLHRAIYYLNSIECAASAMEMSAISAKNVALLSYHQWYGKKEYIDQENLAERLKSEL